VDRLTPEQRSWNMSRVRSANTKPEKAVRSLLHRMGYRFRLHRRDLSGCPDIVLPKYRVIVFVHGCFWHQHVGCRKATIPETRHSFWKQKLTNNAVRDKKVRCELEDDGWRVLVVWECQIKNQLTDVIETLSTTLKDQSKRI
jgi:DNA mismatch endonuclease, patch repair protein